MMNYHELVDMKKKAVVQVLGLELPVIYCHGESSKGPCGGQRVLFHPPVPGEELHLDFLFLA